MSRYREEMSSAEYDALVAAARDDPAVLGLILTGSRGRDAPWVRPDSDWDVRMVVRDDDIADAEARYATPHGSVVEVVVVERSGFETLCLPGGRAGWDRYSYVAADLVLDRDGALAGVLARKARLDLDEARVLAADSLDDYVNSMYRSRRNADRGLETAALLDAAASIEPLLTFRFAVDHRVRPFNEWLDWELTRTGFGSAAWERSAFLERLARITRTADPADQAALFREVEALARERGFGGVIDGWQPDVPWLREA
jgi:hypothetical protein